MRVLCVCVCLCGSDDCERILWNLTLNPLVAYNADGRWRAPRTRHNILYRDRPVATFAIRFQCTAVVVDGEGLGGDGGGGGWKTSRSVAINFYRPLCVSICTRSNVLCSRHECGEKKQCTHCVLCKWKEEWNRVQVEKCAVQRDSPLMKLKSTGDNNNNKPS